MELQMASRKRLHSFKQEEVQEELVQDSQPTCFEPTYFFKDNMMHMILCCPPDKELSCPVTMLEKIDKGTLLAQERLISLMGEFALPWKYMDRTKSVLTVPPIRFPTIGKWYNYLLSEFQIVESSCAGISWFSFFKSRLYPLLRLCTKWLKCAIECEVCHGDLMHNIYFKTDMEPQLLIRGGFDEKGFDKKNSSNGCGSYGRDLVTIKHFLFVIVNKKPLEDLQTDNRLDYRNFNDDVPHYLIDFLELLHTFDKKKHIVDVVFNPSFLWSNEKKFKHLDEAYIFFIKESKFKEINDHFWWQWYADFKKLHENHPLKKQLKLTGSPEIIQSHPPASGYWNPKSKYWNPEYKNDVQLLRLFRNARCHVTEMFSRFGWTQDVVLEQFEEKFNILSKLSQTCNKYAMGLHDEKSRVDFLKRLEYITRETNIRYYQAHS